MINPTSGTEKSEKCDVTSPHDAIGRPFWVSFLTNKTLVQEQHLSKGILSQK